MVGDLNLIVAQQACVYVIPTGQGEFKTNLIFQQALSGLRQFHLLYHVAKQANTELVALPLIVEQGFSQRDFIMAGDKHGVRPG